MHDRFVHVPAARLRGLVDVCDDIPFAWRELLNVSSDVCPECLRGKTHKQGSSAHVPVCTEPGQIVSYDLWKYHIASVCGGYIYFFGAVDNYTSFGFLVALKYKSEAPRALGEVLRQSRAAGVDIKRFHTDNENVLHSKDGHQATVSVECPQGVLVTTGCEYHSRQNAIIERFWRTINDAARPGFSASPCGEAFYMYALIDACSKLNVMPYGDGSPGSPFSAFHGTPGRAAPYRVWGCLAYVHLEHTLNASNQKLKKSDARCVPGILLCYGHTGGLRDRCRPGWSVYVPRYGRDQPITS